MWNIKTENIYLFAIAGQTAGPNCLNIFEGTLEYPGGTIG